MLLVLTNSTTALDVPIPTYVCYYTMVAYVIYIGTSRRPPWMTHNECDGHPVLAVDVCFLPLCDIHWYITQTTMYAMATLSCPSMDASFHYVTYIGIPMYIT